jgi:hypothetical protein
MDYIITIPKWLRWKALPPNFFGVLPCGIVSGPFLFRTWLLITHVFTFGLPVTSSKAYAYYGILGIVYLRTVPGQFTFLFDPGFPREAALYRRVIPYGSLRIIRHIYQVLSVSDPKILLSLYLKGQNLFLLDSGDEKPVHENFYCSHI